MVVDIKIDYSRCNCCKQCVEDCIFGVLEWFEGEPVVVNPNSCSACLACKKGCPVDAINVKEK